MTSSLNPGIHRDSFYTSKETSTSVYIVDDINLKHDKQKVFSRTLTYTNTNVTWEWEWTNAKRFQTTPL